MSFGWLVGNNKPIDNSSTTIFLLADGINNQDLVVVATMKYVSLIYDLSLFKCSFLILLGTDPDSKSVQAAMKDKKKENKK